MPRKVSHAFQRMALISSCLMLGADAAIKCLLLTAGIRHACTHGCFSGEWATWRLYRKPGRPTTARAFHTSRVDFFPGNDE